VFLVAFLFLGWERLGVASFSVFSRSYASLSVPFRSLPFLSFFVVYSLKKVATRLEGLTLETFTSHDQIEREGMFAAKNASET
jgi:hypothetical protein